jgi:four helix bundle protein
MAGYRTLEVYQKAYKLSLEIHRVTQTFPEFERYELGSQLRRATLSIVLNIAEGYGRKDTKAEFQHFLRIALGSCNETLVLLEMSKDLNYLTEEKQQEYCQAYTIIGKQIYRLKEAWSNKSNIRLQ